ncbi:hypothetical protein CIT37_41570 [Bradyrhizobium ottawaense]|uniref:hypothetical protein n=1 Tax=Bradyrhizobium ottawaense TaxID=931866 RepID=UPI0012B682B5|nr:hypothetical protein [Bradyrhizobium ottawaense]
MTKKLGSAERARELARLLEKLRRAHDAQDYPNIKRIRRAIDAAITRGRRGSTRPMS